MVKLKTITLVMYDPIDGNYVYKAIDDNGKSLTTRIEHIACNGKTYVAALITKNTNHRWRYSIANLFTSFDRITTKLITDKTRRRPYAIAILEEHKEAYKEWQKTTWLNTKVAK